ncbi:MAG: response regulator [Synechococcaceae cyanobacterium SM2_3_2]|nr:response regulator [Synechococcaceae cyanobacterium SM2_3_2]
MKTILVVEDSLTDLHIVLATLQQAGFAVITASNEKEAKDQIREKKPDAIILDVVLPDRSGFELCRDLKDEESTKNIPIVMCSTKSSNMDKYWGMQQGADIYLAKPVSSEQLLKSVRSLI